MENLETEFLRSPIGRSERRRVRRVNALTEAEGQGHGLRSQMIERYGRQNLAERGEQAPFLFRHEPVISQSRESGFPARLQGVLVLCVDARTFDGFRPLFLAEPVPIPTPQPAIHLNRKGHDHSRAPRVEGPAIRIFAALHQARCLDEETERDGDKRGHHARANDGQTDEGDDGPRPFPLIEIVQNFHAASMSRTVFEGQLDGVEWGGRS